jgi:hypothetical protein
MSLPVEGGTYRDKRTSTLFTVWHLAIRPETREEIVVYSVKSAAGAAPGLYWWRPVDEFEASFVLVPSAAADRTA